MSKRLLIDLIDTQEPAIDLLRQFAADAEVPCELLPPGPERENALLYLQVTTHSTLGAPTTPAAYSLTTAGCAGSVRVIQNWPAR
jgi:hypothetical protein